MVPETPLSPDDGFSVVQDGMDWPRLPFWEAIFSLSNGFLGTRGSFEEPMPGTRSRGMTFMAGLYNTLPKGLPELPILPDWITTRITLGGFPFDLRLGHIRRFTRWLDMKRGLLCRQVEWESPGGSTTNLIFTRFLSLADRHLAVLRVQITPLDWGGHISLDTGLTMPPVAGGPGGRSGRSHWRGARITLTRDGVCCLRARTSQSDRPLAVAAAYEAEGPGNGAAERGITFYARAGQTYTFDRHVAFMVGAPGANPPLDEARQAACAARGEGFRAQLYRHAAACQELWDRIDVQIDGPPEDQLAVRFNLFQLATLAPRPGDMASIGPKGLSGTHYLGHIFWDTEIYMLPFFSLSDPEAARTLLMYRYHTLEGARRKAQANRRRGAQYAWESADTGDEACPRYLPDPHTGQPIHIWCGDLQDHITADVSYAIHQYARATGDQEFLWTCGAEILFETARFWTSRVTRNASGKYDIIDVMGPDEFHVHVDNDAFTNYLARWNLLAAADLYDDAAFPSEQRRVVIDELALAPDEPETWRQIADNLTLLYDKGTGLIHESAGFTDRPDVSPDILRAPRRGPITDWIGLDLAMQAQVLKQAEVVLLQCLLEGHFDRRSREVNFDYYEPRTSHDSSLSVSAHALAAARLGRIELAYDYFLRAARLDLDDLAGNAADGLHTANMGGVWQAIVFGFAGLNIDGREPSAAPRLPASWKRLSFTIVHRGRRYSVSCSADGASIEPLI